MKEPMLINQPQRREGERGHLLVGLVVLLACMMIMLTAAAQSWTFLVRRDREAEMIHRGEEYAKAIAFYQKEVGAYPLKLDLLAEKGPHGHRFIRKLYEDPLADDGKWGLLYLSPTGQGFINPYATQIGEGFGPDPFGGIGGIGVGGAGGAFGQGGGGAFGQGGGGFGSSNRKSGIGGRRSGKNKEQKPGYSELDQQTFQNFELSNMPIVGVVHKKQEWGLKIYKGQSSLNDWAFTILDEGEQTSIGGGKRQAPLPRGRGPSRGVGDAHNPIFLPGMLPPKPRGPNSTDQQRQDLLKWQEEQEEKRRALEEALNPQQDDEEGTDEDPNGTGDEDPNGTGEGADEDPNGGGEGEDEDPNGTDGEEDEQDDEDDEDD